MLFRTISTYSFMDYIRGGCEINLIVAIDFTVRSCLVAHAKALSLHCIVAGVQW